MEIELANALDRCRFGERSKTGKIERALIRRGYRIDPVSKGGARCHVYRHRDSRLGFILGPNVCRVFAAERKTYLRANSIMLTPAIRNRIARNEWHGVNDGLDTEGKTD